MTDLGQADAPGIVVALLEKKYGMVEWDLKQWNERDSRKALWHNENKSYQISFLQPIS